MRAGGGSRRPWNSFAGVRSSAGSWHTDPAIVEAVLPGREYPQRLEDLALNLVSGIAPRPCILGTGPAEPQPAGAVEKDHALAVQAVTTVLAELAAAADAVASQGRLLALAHR